MFPTSGRDFGKHKPLAGSTRVRYITPADFLGDSVRPVPSSFEKSLSFKTISVVGISVHHRKFFKPSQSKSSEKPVVPKVMGVLEAGGLCAPLHEAWQELSPGCCKAGGTEQALTKQLLRLSVSKGAWKAHCLAEIFLINIRHHVLPYKVVEHACLHLG